MRGASFWTDDAARGFREFASGRSSMALEFWSSASSKLGHDANSGSPCMAFVQNNKGVAFMLQSKIEAARCAFAEAQFHFEKGLMNLRDAEIEPPVASSAQQMRLAVRHGAAFGEAHRQTWISMAEAASAIVRSNISRCANVSAPTGCDPDCHVIARALGPESLAQRIARCDPVLDSTGAIGREIVRLCDLASDLLSRPEPTSLGFRWERAAELSLLMHPRFSTLGPETLSQRSQRHAREA